jgi:mRNA interferase RelE/StbE
MTWAVTLKDSALKQLHKLDRTAAQQILAYLNEKIATSLDPRRFGKSLTGDKSGLWRYRVGDYRIICNILDAELVVVVIEVGHRSDVYR